jgi:Bacterial PH domain
MSWSGEAGLERGDTGDRQSLNDHSELLQSGAPVDDTCADHFALVGWWSPGPVAKHRVEEGAVLTTSPGWAPVLQWGLWAVAIGSGHTLAHPGSILAIGLVVGGFFLLLAVWSALYPDATGSPLISLSFLGFAALGLPLVLDYRNARHTLTPDGLQYGRMLGAGGRLRWAEVRSVRYSEAAKWFRLELAGGGVVRISAMLRGLPEFASAVLAGVPSAAIDEDTRAVLQATARGELPRVWG